MQNKHDNPNKRVLILRLDNIGDVVLFSGALRYLRRLFPNSHLTLAVQQKVLNLVEFCPYVDEVLSADQLSTYRRFECLGARFINPMWRGFYRNIFHGKTKFEKVIYPLKSPQVGHLELIKLLNVKDVSGIIGCDLNILKSSYPTNIKLKEIFRSYLDVSETYPWRHEFLTTMDFLNALGCNIQSINEIYPEFWLADNERNPLEGFIETGRKLIGLFPGAASQKRQWFSENFSQLAGLINVPADFVIFGSASDFALASKIECDLHKTATGRILNLAGKTTLRELVQGIQSCDLFIGMETSGLHIAIASGIKSIGIVGGGHFDRFVPWGDVDRNIFLTNRLDCFHCDWSCKYDRIECLQGITPEKVAEVANTLLR